MKKLFLFTIAISFILCPAFAIADSITPDTFSATIGVGESVTIEKTVTVDLTAGSYAPVDVFFLADTTGSMTYDIAAVQAGAASILSATAGLGDVFYAVGEYEDWPELPYGASTDSPYTLHQDFTNDTVAVQAGIDALTPLGSGWDSEESQLYALEQAAETASWRDGSTRILVWFGDYEGHDPSGPSTLVTATEALVDNDITVQAIDVGYWGLGDQADYIAAATGGTHYTSIATADIVATITAAISYVVDNYSTVGIDLSDVPGGVSASVSPVDYTGSYDRSVARTFDFSVTFTGVTAGEYDFDLYATVDGARVAIERDSIEVGGTAPVPEPATFFLVGSGLLGLVGFRKKIKK